MSDSRLQELKRAWEASGQVEDEAAYLRERVRVGDLRDRREAERLRSTLRADHPGCYIVPDRIEPPALPEEGAGTP